MTSFALSCGHSNIHFIDHSTTTQSIRIPGLQYWMTHRLQAHDLGHIDNLKATISSALSASTNLRMFVLTKI
jgi:hypothetical protein